MIENFKLKVFRAVVNRLKFRRAAEELPLRQQAKGVIATNSSRTSKGKQRSP